jgi:hypothetical protein
VNSSPHCMCISYISWWTINDSAADIYGFYPFKTSLSSIVCNIKFKLQKWIQLIWNYKIMNCCNCSSLCMFHLSIHLHTGLVSRSINSSCQFSRPGIIKLKRSLYILTSDKDNSIIWTCIYYIHMKIFLGEKSARYCEQVNN